MNNNYQYTPQNDQDEFHQNVFGNVPPPPAGHAKGFAIASLCLGIGSIFFTCICCCLFYIAFIPAILAIVFAVLAKRDNGGKMPGMATAGMILAIIGLLFFVCWVLLEFVFADLLYESMNQFFINEFGMTYEEFIQSPYMENYYGDFYSEDFYEYEIVD